MNRQEIIANLYKLNEKLKQYNMRGEIGVFGGAVMCIGLNAREMTHDIDAVFNPTKEMRQLIQEVAEENNLPKDWLNDGVKGFTSSNNDMFLFSQLSNLDIYMTRPKYLFAMKCLSCRMNNENELNDIKFLIKYLGITTVEQALSIIGEYYPSNQIKPKTQYMLMEIFQGGI